MLAHSRGTNIASVASTLIAGALTIAGGVSNAVLLGRTWRPIVICIVGICAGLAILIQQVLQLRSSKDSRPSQQSTRASVVEQAISGGSYILLAALLTDYPLQPHQRWLYYLNVALAACGVIKLFLCAILMLFSTEHTAVPVEGDEKQLILPHHVFGGSQTHARTSSKDFHPSSYSSHSHGASSMSGTSLTSTSKLPTVPQPPDGSDYFVYSTLPVERSSAQPQEERSPELRSILQLTSENKPSSRGNMRGPRELRSGSTSSSATLSHEKAPSASTSPRPTLTIPPALQASRPIATSHVQATPSSASSRNLGYQIPPLKFSRTSNDLGGGAPAAKRRQNVTIPGLGDVELSSDSEYEDDAEYDEEEESHVEGSLLGNPNDTVPSPSSTMSYQSQRNNTMSRTKRRMMKEARAIKRELSKRSIAGSIDPEKAEQLRGALNLA